MQAEQKIQEIYIGLLGRAADAEGLDYWVGEYQSGIMSYNQIRENLVNAQAEYATGLGSMARAEVITELYQRFFHREPEKNGFDYWTSGDGGNVPVDKLVLALANGASDDDRSTLDNKINMADYYTRNYPYKESDAKLILDDISSYESVEQIKAIEETYDDLITLSAKSFTALSVESLQQAIRFDVTPGRIGTPSADNFQTIEGIQGYGQIFDTGAADIVVNYEAYPGIAAISPAGLASFASTDVGLADHLFAVEKGIATGDAQAGQAAIWQEGRDAFLFISDGVDGISENDTLIRLVGINTNDAAYDYLVDIGDSFALA